MLHLNPQLKNLIDKLWNKFWAGGISNPLTAIEQITYLIFMKKIEEIDLKRKADAKIGKEYKSLFEGMFPEATEEEKKEIENGKEDKVFRIKKEKLRWSYIKHLESQERLDHISQFVFPFLKELNGKNSHFTKHMRNAVFVIPSPSVLHEAISIIEEIFKEIEKDALKNGQAFQDIQGDVYEHLLSEIASAGKNGQFRTPRHIINLVVELVQPKFGNKIGDPACGTGGFLLGAFQYIVSKEFDQDNKYSIQDENGFVRSTSRELLNENRKNVIEKSLRGYDIDVTMVRLGLMNLMMHGIDNPNIDYTNTLSKSFQKYSDELNSYDVIFANPPFTGNLNRDEIDDILTLSTTKTELLFIDRIHSMLRDGGTAGIIIPQGVLFGSAKAFVNARRIMIEKSQLKAVITMPSGIFKPYAGVATAILIFTKGRETDKVFFYDMQSDGYSLDDRRVKHEGYGDLQNIITEYKNRATNLNDRSGNVFMVSKEEIEKNNWELSHSSYKEDVSEELKYDDPKDILDTLSKLEKEIQTELNKIKSLYQ
jgi:type I restriction enzyme M protein